MIALTRLAEPQILVERGTLWFEEFLASGAARPSSTKYGHKAIRANLNSMSFHKCFYCETKLKGVPKEVDHQIEVSIDKSGAYRWDNLYLSCSSCNKKIDNNDIPFNTALDPCRNDDLAIRANLTFEKHSIATKDNSVLGLSTIKKYRLDSDVLDSRRMIALQRFYELLIAIRDQQLNEGGRAMTPEELSLIRQFGNSDQPFSLMFRVILKKNGL